MRAGGLPLKLDTHSSLQLYFSSTVNVCRCNGKILPENAGQRNYVGWFGLCVAAVTSVYCLELVVSGQE